MSAEPIDWRNPAFWQKPTGLQELPPMLFPYSNDDEVKISGEVPFPESEEYRQCLRLAIMSLAFEQIRENRQNATFTVPASDTPNSLTHQWQKRVSGEWVDTDNPMEEITVEVARQTFLSIPGIVPAVANDDPPEEYAPDWTVRDAYSMDN